MLELVRYTSLFSGKAVERVPELQFQRPVAEAEIAYADAERLGLAEGDRVVVRSNGSSRTLSARVNRRLLPGVVRIESSHAVGFGESVEIARA
jgi:anaerobic selenocysteine-containing dehydrogenase